MAATVVIRMDDHLRSWRRDLVKVGATMAVISLIAGASGRISANECWAALALFLLPPAFVWIAETARKS